MAPSVTTARDLLSAPSPSSEELAASFDQLSPADAIVAARLLGGTRLQGALWNAVEANDRITVDDMVPADYERERPVIFHGKNSLPAFTEFEKICFRPRDEDAGNVLWGYNEGRTRRVVGPGYYVLHDTKDAALGACAFDYTQIPPRTLTGWPPVKPNSAGVSRFVYNNMIDYMRRVSRDVFIGEAVRGGREMGSYFIVVRELT